MVLGLIKAQIFYALYLYDERDFVISTRVKNLVSPKDEFKINFFIYSKNYDTSNNVADALRVAFDNKRGTYSNVKVDWVVFEDETTGDPIMEDKIYWMVQDYLFKINNI